LALIDLLSIDKHYEAQTILKEVNFHIDESERIVIVGQNGSGKSTLMKIANGTLDFDEGNRIVRNNLQIKMLSQHPQFSEGMNVKEAIEAELKELKVAKNRYDELSSKLATEYDNQDILNEHARLTSYLDHHNAWNLDDKVERVMQEFQLKQYETKEVNLLSGGEQRRVALAGLLLQKPDVLLLDEPTNHLDVYMVEFLEELLLKEKFTLLFISHDRYFIDKVATKTVEIENAGIREFAGGYARYLEQKNALLESMQKGHDNLLRLLRQEEKWFGRGVRARLKRNEGRKQRLMDLRQEAKTNPAAIRKMTLSLQREQKHFQRDKSVNKQKMLFELDSVSKSLGDKKLIENFSTRILQRDRIAVVGHNGSGKSTLLKLLLGRMKFDSGKYKKGEFSIGYFDQHREMLDNEKNLIETFCPHGGDRVEVQGSNMHVYGYLKNFLFPREFLDKKIGVLSGGEKNRVALALLFTKNVDCIILDEPTNDLDIPTINILEEKLLNFPGALILVSHDRYFVDKIAKKLLIFKGNGIVEESFQNYSEYLEDESTIRELQIMDLEAQNQAPKKEKPKTEKKAKLSFQEKKDLEELPEQIENYEQQIEKLNNCLSNPNCYQDEGLDVLSSRLSALETSYETMVERYLMLEEKQEALNLQ
jgi:ATP-binding cassette subfamily F protein uup